MVRDGESAIAAVNECDGKGGLSRMRWDGMRLVFSDVVEIEHSQGGQKQCVYFHALNHNFVIDRQASIDFAKASAVLH